MSCMACTRKYGFFCKESGCPNCGYSFCTKCLKKAIEVPRCNGAKLNVCLKCFETLEKRQQTATSVSPSDALLLDIDKPPIDLGPVLEPMNPTAGPELTKEDDDISGNLDSVISKRLQGLKKCGSKELPSETDLAVRLADLKGIPYREQSKSDILLSKDTRSDKEKIDDLLLQFVEENTINSSASGTASESSTDPIADIERRLAALRGEDISAPAARSKPQAVTPDTPSDNEEDEEMAAQRIVTQFLNEVQLPAVPISEEEREIIAGLPPPTEQTEQLPWCAICNEDAVTRCLGCDGELFCSTCFRECHEDEDFKEHQSEPYSKPPTFKEDHF